MFSVIVRYINLHAFANKGSLGGRNSNDDNDHDFSDTTFNGRSVLLEIFIRHISTLVTTVTALELCVLIMITASDPESFVLQHLRAVMVHRFSPFEPGDMHTFKRGEHDRTVAINLHNPSEKRYTVAQVVPVLFQLHNDIFIDQETVLRLIFLNAFKCINTMAEKTERTNRSSIKYCYKMVHQHLAVMVHINR